MCTPRRVCAHAYAHAHARIGARTMHPQKALRRYNLPKTHPHNNNNLLKYNNNNNITPAVIFSLQVVTPKNVFFKLHKHFRASPPVKHPKKLSQSKQKRASGLAVHSRTRLGQPALHMYPSLKHDHRPFQPRDGRYFIRPTPPPPGGRAASGGGGSKIQPLPPLSPRVQRRATPCPTASSLVLPSLTLPRITKPRQKARATRALRTREARRHRLTHNQP